MGEKEVKDKLATKLKSVPKTEEDVVYILSRIRKILEINDYPSKFSTLNFYCNLTLHAKISRPPKDIIDKLKKIRDAEDGWGQTLFDLTRKDFHTQLKLFCEIYNMVENFYSDGADSKKLLKFNDLLLSIWSHTPIRIEYTESFDFIIEARGNGNFILSSKPSE